MSDGGIILEVVRQLNSGVLVAALALLCVFGASQVWHLVQYVRLQAKGLAREATLLSHPLPADEQLPHVLLQVPTMNEGRLVHRIAEAAGNLDWPRDRLHIQILDDSTDGSSDKIAGKAAAALRLRGIDATVLHRTNRIGFKAAALQAGLQQSTHEYVAVLDAEFVPPPDFLRRCLRILLADPALAFVQARWDATNANDNALTRTQQRIIDVSFAIDAARSWSDHFVIFHGSCAVWRRAAVDDIGGWVSDILPEDFDISYRALLRGWRALSLMTVAVPGELPNTNAAWIRQQYRWNGGVAQAMRKYLPLVWRSGLSPARKLIASLPLVYSVFGSVLGISAVAAALQIPLATGASIWVRTLMAVAVAETIIGVFGMALASQRLLRGTSPWSELPHTLTGFGIFVYMQLVVVKSLFDALLGKVVIWMPTPKQRGRSTPSARQVDHRSAVESQSD